MGRRAFVHSEDSGRVPRAGQARRHLPSRPTYTGWRRWPPCRRVRKFSNAQIFEAAVSPGADLRRFIDELPGLFGGRARPLMAHLIESARLTPDDLQNAERVLHEQAQTEAPK